MVMELTEWEKLNIFICKCNADKEIVLSWCCEGSRDSESFGYQWSSDLCDQQC